MISAIKELPGENLPTMEETQVPSLGWEDTLEKGMATHSSILAWRHGFDPGSGRSPGEGNGNPLQYACLGNPMDRRAWWATVDGVTMNWTQLCSD